MLDAAEQVLCEEGYGALTSRNIADRIGVKQRLVYYYFRTMDELIVETFRRLAVREKLRLTAALEASRPLAAVWDVYVDTSDTRLVSEFMALANRNEDLRLEVKQFIEDCRAMQIQALSGSMRANDQRGELSPVVAAFFATSAALAMHREAEIGITSGHQEVMAAIASFIAERDSN